MIRLFAPRFPDTTEALIDGRPIRVSVRVSQRARSYRLSIPHGGGPVLTVPAHGRWTEAQDFLTRHHGWLSVRLRRAPRATPFAAGETIPLRGIGHRVIGTGRLRGRVEAGADEDGPILLVPGDMQHHGRRLVDWLKAEAGRDLRLQSDRHATTLGVRVLAVSLRDQTTRWGSCSTTGRLSYNWRLIMAPDFVLDYVAAHEVAHLKEMNHSIRFWRAVEQALPDMERGRAWLKAHGSELMAYGTGG